MSINFETGCSGVVNPLEDHDINFVETLMKLPCITLPLGNTFAMHAPEALLGQMKAGPESSELEEAPEAEAGPQAVAAAGSERRQDNQSLVILRTCAAEVWLPAVPENQGRHGRSSGRYPGCDRHRSPGSARNSQVLGRTEPARPDHRQQVYRPFAAGPAGSDLRPPRHSNPASDDIDNNAAERGFRPFGIGRRNWLFAGSDAGGRTATKPSTTALLFSAQHQYNAS